MQGCYYGRAALIRRLTCCIFMSTWVQ